MMTARLSSFCKEFRDVTLGSTLRTSPWTTGAPVVAEELRQACHLQWPHSEPKFETIGVYRCRSGLQRRTRDWTNRHQMGEMIL